MICLHIIPYIFTIMIADLSVIILYTATYVVFNYMQLLGGGLITAPHATCKVTLSFYNNSTTNVSWAFQLTRQADRAATYLKKFNLIY
jgi:hypothetical protein